MEEKAKNLSLDGVEVDVVHVTRAPNWYVLTKNRPVLRRK